MIASQQGGVDIETVAEKTPEAIFKEPIDIFTGPQAQQLERLATSLGFKGAQVQDVSCKLACCINIITLIKYQIIGCKPNEAIVRFIH